MKDREVQIMKYTSGLLAGEDLDKFEQEMTIDSDLREEVASYQQLEGFSKKRKDLNSSRSTLSKVHEDFSKIENQNIEQPHDVKSNIGKWLLLIAIAVGVILLVIFMKKGDVQQQSTDVLFAEYFNPDEASFQTKGEGTSEELIKAQIYFNQRDYKKANETFDKLISEKDKPTELMFYNSLALIGINQHADGRSQLMKVAEGETVYKNEAYWYIALSFIKEGDKSKAQEYLTKIKEGANKYSTAQDLLQLL